MFVSDNAPHLLDRLNTQQLSAVTYPAQSILILAGAGSGKTRVLTTRIAWLLQNGMADVRQILAVTFTNKAAKEMHARLSAIVPFSVRAMWLGTFHGLCHRFLRLHYRDAQLPQNFQIMDTSDQLSLIKRLLKQANLAEETLAPRELQGFINAQKENGLRAEHLHPENPHQQQLITLYHDYEQMCQREGVVDFAELMLRSYELLQRNEALRQHYQQRFRHILIDEFQDTNTLQYSWLKLIAGTQNAIFAVGDDDQSIYRFRGANIGNMTALMHEFHIESPIKLEQNYRSAGNILIAANAVIANNANRLGKNLRTDAGTGEKIRLFHALNDTEESRFIVEESQYLCQKGLAYQNIAILYRSNAQSRVIEQTLFQSGIPYKIYGGLRFYERQEIKHALAYLRLAAAPEDDNAFLRIVNFPPRGIGTRSVENLQTIATEQRISLLQAASNLTAQNAKIAAFVRMMQQFQAQIGVLRLPEILQNIIIDSGLYAHYQQHKQANERERTDNLDELINAAYTFNPANTFLETLPEEWDDTANPQFDVLAFLSNAALESGEKQAGEGENAVQLMTIHAAKGLEFDAVFITGLEEGRFPSELSLSEHDGLSEERRLMYVAITRARQRLYLTMAQERRLYGHSQAYVSSRFIDEIPSEIVQTLNAPLKTHNITLPEDRGDFDGFCIGENVIHPQFGMGVIIDATSKNHSARLFINFGKHGIKELDTAFAKLQKA